MDLPPVKMVLGALRDTVLPAVGGAAVVTALFAAAGRRAAGCGAAAAVVAGYCWANFTFDALSLTGTFRIFPWLPDGTERTAHWLPIAGLALLAAGCATRALRDWLTIRRRLSARRTESIVWGARAAVVLLACRRLTPAEFVDPTWAWPGLSATTLLNWWVLERVADRDGNAGVAGGMAAAFLASATILLHHHWTAGFESSTALSFAMLGVFLVGRASGCSVTGAVPAAAVLLPGLMLNGRLGGDSQVPLASFVIVGLAPVAFAPALAPAVARMKAWKSMLVLSIGVLALLAIACVLAARAEDLTFSDW